MKRTVLAALVLLTAAPMPAIGNPPPDFGPLVEQIRRTKDATSHPFGTAIVVVKDGKVLHESYSGFGDMQSQLPVTGDTAFYIASATKPFLALNTLLKEHHRQLDTGTSLQQMFPDIRFQGFDAQQVTISDLLTHTSGIDNTPLVWATAFTGLHDAASRRRLVAGSVPHSEVGHGAFDYTNVGYNLLGVWLDERFGMPWQDQLDTAIFQPLGMQQTSAYISEAEAEGWPLAKPYSFASVQPDRPLYLTKADNTMQAAGGLVSTAPDLADFLLAQLSVYAPERESPLPSAVIERSHLAQTPVDDAYFDFQRTGYAWGWYTGMYKERRMLHHFGGFAGFHAHLSFMPDEGIGLVVLNNDDQMGARLTNLIADYVYGVALGQAPKAPALKERFDRLRAKALDLRQSVQAHRDEIQARPWNLALPLVAYAGTYSHANAGDIVVTSGDQHGMQIQWGRLSAAATGYEERDHVRVELVPNAGSTLAFRVEEGESVALTFEEMEFIRTR